MPAFCYVRHDPGGVRDDTLNAMASALAPARFNGRTTRYRVRQGTLLVWTAPHTPFDLFSDPGGGTAMLLGEALDNDTSRIITAETLYHDWTGMTKASGYYGWLVLRASGELVAGADPLGLFPLYTMTDPGPFALATSTAVLRCHPRYDRTLDRVGVARHLLENGCASARTLERGSRRLQPGEILHLRDGPAGKPILLDRSVDWLCDSKITDPHEAVARSIAWSGEAYRRHTQTFPRAMLLSGGLDTRHLAALAARAGHRPDGYTLGEPTDVEAVLARRTCRGIGGRWHCFPESMPAAQTMIDEELSLLSLAGGFSTVTMTGFESLRYAAVPRVTTGLLLDVHYSPFYRTPSRFETTSLAYAMDVWINRFGIPAGVLQAMARPGDMRDAVEEALREIAAEWNALPGDLADRHWQVILRHRMRPHLGSHVWKVCFHTWPQMIATDVPFVRMTRTVSAALLRDRFLQRQTVASLAPELARIPLDTMSDKPTSILPSRWNTLHHRWHRLQLHRAGRSVRDAHRYPRIMDIDTAVWRDMRREAEAGRAAAELLFDPDALRAYLPVYPAPARSDHLTFAGQWGLRMTVGMMLWLTTTGR